MIAHNTGKCRSLDLKSNMAETSTGESVSPASDRDFDPSAEMLIHDYDDERTIDEEEACSNEDAADELDDLKKEGEMSIEQLMAMYGGGVNNAVDIRTSSPPSDSQDTRSSSEEDILSNRDLTLDKEEIAKDLLQDDDADITATANVNDLLDSVSHTVRLLRNNEEPCSDDDSEDEDYQPDREDWKKVIQVGSDYQAKVPPGLSCYEDSPAYENEDSLLWDPSKINDSQVLDYLTQVQQQKQSSEGDAGDDVDSIPEGPHIKDDEQALYLLLQCGLNVEEALRRIKMQGVPPADTMSLWSEEECQNFENGLRLYGKNFHLVQLNKVRTRSVGELIQFYYLWKKTERHDVFASKTRLEKRKYALHPGLTDYMNRILDEQDAPLAIRERAGSPGAYHMLLYDGNKQRSVQPLSPSAQLKEHLSKEELATAMELVEKVVTENDIKLQNELDNKHVDTSPTTESSTSSRAVNDIVDSTTSSASASEIVRDNTAAVPTVVEADSTTTTTSQGSNAALNFRPIQATDVHHQVEPRLRADLPVDDNDDAPSLKRRRLTPSPSQPSLLSPESAENSFLNEVKGDIVQVPLKTVISSEAESSNSFSTTPLLADT